MNDSAPRTLSAVEPLARALPAGLREGLLARLFGCIRAGRLTVSFPSGARRTFAGDEPGPQAVMAINDLGLLFRVFASGGIGFAESYMAGEWDTPDLRALLRLGARNADALGDALKRSRVADTLNRLRHARRANTRTGSRRNIQAHYDLGNDFYRLWLDDTMTYSSALFEADGESLEAAQQRKYARLAAALGIAAGERVLEIGCGWGGFAEYAAGELGAHVTGITLSAEQAAYARARMARAGLANRVEIRVQDYRELDGLYDKIVSIEMFEAVGEAYWPTFFDVLERRLKPGGRAGLQVINIDEDAFKAYRRRPDFIQRYIFPGGMLPSPRAFSEAARDKGLAIVDSFDFGPCYAETLRRWDRAFRRHWPEIEALGFDRRFFRMWHYYLTYCEVGFDAGRIEVTQYVVARA